MLIILDKNASLKDISQVVTKVEELGLKPHISKTDERTTIGIVGNENEIPPLTFEKLNGVKNVIPIVQPFKLASREFKSENTQVKLRDTVIGGKEVVVMAGPCAVENEEQIMQVAKAAKKAGATILRGGAFKPRTSPYSFRGLAEKGLKILKKAREETGLAIVTEVLSCEHVDLVAEYTDIIQIGTRNMQNFALLEAVGKSNKPVLLKRGLMSSLEELLMSAEYILSNGNYQVMLCERGIRTFEKYTRNTLDISAVPLVKKLSHLPIIIDPSHSAGNADLVSALSKAGLAAGADGLIIEVHPDPKKSVSDGAQSLDIEQFEKLMKELKPVAEAVGRKL